MEKKGLASKGVKCFGCGAVLEGADKEVGLCKSCSERSIEEGFEMVGAEAREEFRADAMVYV